MIEFYQGTPETVMERLCKTIASFDGAWLENCLPATDEQIEQLESICNQYGYSIPKVYLDYLMLMGEKDGGLLEREWDGGMEPNISRILEQFDDEEFTEDTKEQLQRGFLLFSYDWAEAHCYLKVADWADNPMVTDLENRYFAGSLEKYLFQKAFLMYQEKFEYKSSVGTSILSCDKLLKKHSFPCSVLGGTPEEKMAFVRWLVKYLELPEGEVWFGDDLHYFSYNEHYALRVDNYHSLLLVFSCDDKALKKKVDSKLNQIF